MIKMQEDVVLVLAHAASCTNFHRHRARDDVTRGKILRGWRITLHEALAFRIGEITTFATRSFGDEAACAINAGRMELHEFHILQRQACAQHHRIAIARAGMRRRGREISAAISTRRKDDHVRTETMDRSIIHLERDHAAATALLIHDEIEREIFDEEFRRITQRLPIERVQNGVAGAVCRSAGALRGAFAVIRRHAAERALIDLACFGARERHAPMLKLIHSRRRIAAEIFDCVLVAEPVRPLDGVIHMPAPIVRTHIAERGRDAALRCNSVRACREHFRDARRPQTCLRAADCGAQTGATRTDDDDVEGMVGDGIGSPFIRAAIGLAVGGTGHGITLRKRVSEWRKRRQGQPQSRRTC